MLNSFDTLALVQPTCFISLYVTHSAAVRRRWLLIMFARYHHIIFQFKICLFSSLFTFTAADSGDAFKSTENLEK